MWSGQFSENKCGLFPGPRINGGVYSGTKFRTYFPSNFPLLSVTTGNPYLLRIDRYMWFEAVIDSILPGYCACILYIYYYEVP